MKRLIKFNAVGAAGVVVQMLMLALFARVFHMHYLAATALAVEAAVLHNFAWHSKWTWADRRQSARARALLRFNLTAGAVSIAGNLLFMFALVEGAHLNAYMANLLSIALCSLANFIISDRFVFA